jgi:hypothetical protein
MEQSARQFVEGLGHSARRLGQSSERDRRYMQVRSVLRPTFIGLQANMEACRIKSEGGSAYSVTFEDVVNQLLHELSLILSPAEQPQFDGLNRPAPRA